MSVRQKWNKITGNGFLIMAAESGQSVLELLLVLPLMLVLVFLLIKINTAIQVSIVNQQYARAQALYLAYNSPYFPALTNQVFQEKRLINKLEVGVSQNLPENDSNFEPEATVQNIARNTKIVASDDPKTLPTLRTKVRIRTTVTLCTQNVILNTAKGWQSTPQGSLLGQNSASELGASYCQGALEYEQ
jgi:hypothetical protein